MAALGDDVVKPKVLIAIRTYTDTVAVEFGRSLVGSLCEEDPRLVPEFAAPSDTERFKEPFGDIEHFLTKWWAQLVKGRTPEGRLFEYFLGPAWKRKSPLASRCYIDHGLITAKLNKHPGRIRYECRWHKSVDFSHLFDAWVDISHADIAICMSLQTRSFRKI